MSRLRVLAANPRLALGALLTLLLAAGAVIGSGADFTASSANPANTFASGTLSIVNSKEGAAVLSASGLRPTGSAVGTVDIENTGSLSGAFTLSTSNVVDTASLLGQLDLKVEDCGTFTGTTPPNCAGTNFVYNGKANAVGTPALGTYAANAKHRYQFSVTMPSAIANTFQGKTAAVEFDWDAAA